MLPPSTSSTRTLVLSCPFDNMVAGGGDLVIGGRLAGPGTAREHGGGFRGSLVHDEVVVAPSPIGLDILDLRDFDRIRILRRPDLDPAEPKGDGIGPGRADDLQEVCSA